MTASKRWPEFLRSGDDLEPDLPIERSIEQGDDALDLDSLTLSDLRMPGPGHSSDFEDDDEDLADFGEGSRRYLKPIALTVALLLCAATVIFYGYRWMFGGPVDTNLPLVHAIDDPVKVKPESPGGLVVPYKEQLVLNQGTTGAGGEPVVERLLPPPEAPKWPPAPPASLSPAKPEGGATAPEPAETTAAASGQEAAAASDQKAAAAATSPTKTEPSAKPAVEESKTAALTAQPVQSGGYTLQLASITSKDAAGPAWKDMQKAHPDLLGPLSLSVEKANVSGKTYYRIQAGTFTDRTEAQGLCARLKAGKQDCLVVRR